MDVERLGRAVPVGVPDLVEDLAPGPHRTGVLGQQRQEGELLGREVDGVAADAHPVRATVELEPAEPQAAVAGVGGRRTPTPRGG